MPNAAEIADIKPAAQERFSIAELSQHFDVTPRTIRHYEAEGLIAPRREGQQRIFSKRDRTRLAWILRGKRVGFSLTEIRDLLDIYESDGPVRQQARLVEKCRERVDALTQQRRDIDETITDLTNFMDAVRDLSETATA